MNTLPKISKAEGFSYRIPIIKLEPWLDNYPLNVKKEILKNYSHLRLIKKDEKCLYFALVFAFFEALIRKTNSQVNLLQHFVKNLKGQEENLPFKYLRGNLFKNEIEELESLLNEINPANSPEYSAIRVRLDYFSKSISKNPLLLQALEKLIFKAVEKVKTQSSLELTELNSLSLALSSRIKVYEEDALFSSGNIKLFKYPLTVLKLGNSANCILYSTNLMKIDEYGTSENEYLEMSAHFKFKQSSEEEVVESSPIPKRARKRGKLECSICSEENYFCSMVINRKCNHTYCKLCYQQIVLPELEKDQFDIPCPTSGCKEYLLSVNEIQNEKDVENIQSAAVDRIIPSENLFISDKFYLSEVLGQYPTVDEDSKSKLLEKYDLCRYIEYGEDSIFLACMLGYLEGLMYLSDSENNYINTFRRVLKKKESPQFFSYFRDTLQDVLTLTETTNALGKVSIERKENRCRNVSTLFDLVKMNAMFLNGLVLLIKGATNKVKREKQDKGLILTDEAAQILFNISLALGVKIDYYKPEFIQLGVKSQVLNYSLALLFMESGSCYLLYPKNFVSTINLGRECFYCKRKDALSQKLPSCAQTCDFYCCIDHMAKLGDELMKKNREERKCPKCENIIDGIVPLKLATKKWNIGVQARKVRDIQKILNIMKPKPKLPNIEKEEKKEPDAKPNHECYQCKKITEEELVFYGGCEHKFCEECMQKYINDQLKAGISEDFGCPICGENNS